MRLIYLKPDCCSLFLYFIPIYGPPFLSLPIFQRKRKREVVGGCCCPGRCVWNVLPQRAHTPSSTSPSCGHLAKWRYNSGHSPLWINSSPDLLVSASRRVYWQTRNPPKKKKNNTSSFFPPLFAGHAPWTRLTPFFFPWR